MPPSRSAAPSHPPPPARGRLCWWWWWVGVGGHRLGPPEVLRSRTSGAQRMEGLNSDCACSVCVLPSVVCPRKRAPGGPCYRFHLHALWRHVLLAIAALIARVLTFFRAGTGCSDNDVAHSSRCSEFTGPSSSSCRDMTSPPGYNDSSSRDDDVDSDMDASCHADVDVDCGMTSPTAGGHPEGPKNPPF